MSRKTDSKDREQIVGPYVEAMLRYCEDVASGAVPACKHVKAVTKHYYDLFYDPPEGRYFDCVAAHDVCAFIETLPHIKGEWARNGATIKLEDWQCFVLCVPFGWKYADTGKRVIRTIYEEVPRKNAKSTIAAGIGLYMFVKDGEPGAEVYSTATKRDQAKIVFNIAREMARRLDFDGVVRYAHNMHSLETASLFQPLHSEGSTMDGLNIHCGVNDELHAWKRRDVYEVLDTATGSRTQPLMYNVTTAGTNLDGICYDLHLYAKRIADGLIEDESFFGIIYSIDDGDPWDSEESWRKANPNYNVSVYPNDLRRLAKKASNIASEQTAFLNKRLNVWTSASEAWMPLKAYLRCGDGSLAPDQFEGERVWVGADLASKNDIACLSLIFKRTQNKTTHWYNFVMHYLPEEAINENPNRNNYATWAREGFIRTTPGRTLDVEYIERDCAELGKRFDVVEVAFDPGHNSTQFGLHMEEVYGSVAVVEVRPTVLNFSEPMKWLEAFVMDGRWHHNGDPVLAWMFSNVVCKRDHKDNIYPRKDRYENKIDGVVATIMALNRAMADEQVAMDGVGVTVA